MYEDNYGIVVSYESVVDPRDRHRFYSYKVQGRLDPSLQRRNNVKNTTPAGVPGIYLKKHSWLNSRPPSYG